MSFRLPLAASSAFVAAFSLSSHAQELEQVDVFRDAAVVTWSASAEDDNGALARSFHSGSISDAMVFPAAADGMWGALKARIGTWSPDIADATAAALLSDAEDARLELALKRRPAGIGRRRHRLAAGQPQSDRNRRGPVGRRLGRRGPDWMHGEMKDLLFRRVELNMEIAAQEEVVQVLEKKVASQESHGGRFTGR